MPRPLRASGLANASRLHPIRTKILFIFGGGFQSPELERLDEIYSEIPEYKIHSFFRGQNWHPYHREGKRFIYFCNEGVNGALRGLVLGARVILCKWERIEQKHLLIRNVFEYVPHERINREVEKPIICERVWKGSIQKNDLGRVKLFFLPYLHVEHPALKYQLIASYFCYGLALYSLCINVMSGMLDSRGISAFIEKLYGRRFAGAGTSGDDVPVRRCHYLMLFHNVAKSHVPREATTFQIASPDMKVVIDSTFSPQTMPDIWSA